MVDSTAWRVDFSDVFEKFVQHIFKEVAKETGGKLFANFKFHSRTSKHYSWELKHIEPDAIYQKENFLYSSTLNTNQIYTTNSITAKLLKTTIDTIYTKLWPILL